MENNSPPKFKLYDTMTKEKKVFEPKVPGKVGMYVCGVTTYDFSHIGHARAYVAFDILYRYLKYLGYEVNYVRNFTDIDDKIIKRANESNEDPLDLSKRFCDEFLLDMDALQCLSPTTQPRVTEHIEDIVEMIAKIIENDFAYAVDGDVYFAVDKFPNYGDLSGRKLEDNRAGERVTVDSRKRNPADFALWKAAKPGEPSWDSPWGLGRPGWHIECSAMSARYLGHSFDIHGGGMDLTFPHHENELAQSCAACSETHISYWVHNGFVNVNNEKMAKSKGNFFTIRTVFDKYHPLALRYFLISMHYRSPVNYSLDQLENASDAVYYIYQTLQDCKEALLPLQEGNSDDKPKKTIQIPPDAKECIDKLKKGFCSGMSDDLHTPFFVNASLQDSFKFINASITKLKKTKQKQQQLPIVKGLTELVGQVKVVLEVLGLLSTLSYPEVLQQLKEKALIRASKTEEYVLQQIRERAEARENKEYKRSDQIRSDLATLGIALMDVDKDTTIWRPCVRSVEEANAASSGGDEANASSVPSGGEEANASSSTQ